MFGRKPKLPIDVQFGKVTEEIANKTTREFVEDLKDQIKKTRQIVEQHTEMREEGRRDITTKRQKQSKSRLVTKFSLKE